MKKHLLIAVALAGIMCSMSLTSVQAEPPQDELRTSAESIFMDQPVAYLYNDVRDFGVSYVVCEVGTLPIRFEIPYLKALPVTYQKPASLPYDYGPAINSQNINSRHGTARFARRGAVFYKLA